ncbi:tetratricopeptide repeat protein [Pseudomaricurvus sp. HS19]|uniref:tetratricopeptide repeat protein n=1 Tax=Pseudomaricurvus sp. HS19 TaxID=2692626 RepID=UPI00136BCC14|nr:tetratricopeptide repeat protein [Pseudomaricurvus sp. HS19]MYM61747.1 tetratricopeptide repeat protein [Pseudomaricurvus sp. HS19]
MKYLRTIAALGLPALLASCSGVQQQGTLAELKNVRPVLEDATIADGLDKAMDSYRVFLKETPESAMTPEAIRRIADLSLEKEYGYVNDLPAPAAGGAGELGEGRQLDKPEAAKPARREPVMASGTAIGGGSSESDRAFEDRASQVATRAHEEEQGLGDHPGAASDLENANARQAITLYKKLLAEYPLYDRNDQVLYQMSRAYEELGEIEEAMRVMNQFITTYPDSRYMDEVQFRRAEFFFSRKKYFDAEDAYKSIVAMGENSYYYELALYKLGWSYYKQFLFEESLDQFIALLDYKVSIGYDFDQQLDPIDSKLVDDTYRVISLGFSNLGGPEVVAEYFTRNGARDYEDKVYSNLGEFYLDKRRYADAAGSYKTFINGHPFAEISPHFAMRMVEIYHQGRFGQLVIETKKEFADTYALDTEYWLHNDIDSRPEVVDFLKGNLKDLAGHYHALYQDKRFAKEKVVNYAEALVWYRRYLSTFPQGEDTPPIHYQMADLMMENRDFGKAAEAYEYTAYNYPLHDQSSAAGYAAVYAYREYLKSVPVERQAPIQQKVVDTSLMFADRYPEHEKVTVVLGAAADDLYKMQNFPLAVSTAQKLITQYPDAEVALRRSAWLVVGHGSFDQALYPEAEKGYQQVLALTPANDVSRPALFDNLAASIYKQGELANQAGEYQVAADHFLRVGVLAPTSTIRANAEFDGATALIELQDWTRATGVLLNFRSSFKGHELQPEITKKLAYVYKSDGKSELAGAEYERIYGESQDEEVRRGSLLLAAELYEEAGSSGKQLAAYKTFVKAFPAPLENALEIYSKMAAVYLAEGQGKQHITTLRTIVALDRDAGASRTDRTQYLAAEASLVLAQPYFDQFAEVQIVQPIKPSLEHKKALMKKALNAFSKLLDYEVADVTAAATFYTAEIYFNFSRALAKSERPTNLSDLELEEYELALEDQIYPFEEKAIAVHRKNVELLYAGIYSGWIEKSIGKLAETFPAMYAREEQHSGVVESIDHFRYIIRTPQPVVPEGEAVPAQPEVAPDAQSAANEVGSGGVMPGATEVL